MALNIKNVIRKFSFTKTKGGKQDLADPNPALTPEEVLTFYTSAYPELTTATISGPSLTPDAALYEFKTTVGTKG